MSDCDINAEDFIMPGYKSDIYYDVVIGNKKWNGWYAPYVGLGGMTFYHEDGKEFKTSHGSDDDWMKRCWYDFIKHVAETQ